MQPTPRKFHFFALYSTHRVHLHRHPSCSLLAACSSCCLALMPSGLDRNEVSGTRGLSAVSAQIIIPCTPTACMARQHPCCLAAPRLARLSVARASLPQCASALQQPTAQLRTARRTYPERIQLVEHRRCRAVTLFPCASQGATATVVRRPARPIPDSARFTAQVATMYQLDPRCVAQLGLQCPPRRYSVSPRLAPRCAAAAMQAHAPAWAWHSAQALPSSLQMQ